MLTLTWLGLQTFSGGVQLRADMLALLPTVQQQPSVQTAVTQQAQAFEQLVALAVTFENELDQPLTDLAQIIEGVLTETDIAKRANEGVLLGAWRRHAYQLLTDTQRKAIAANPDKLLATTRQALYGLGGVAEPIDLVLDPLRLHPGYVAQFAPDAVEPLSLHVFEIRRTEPTLLISFEVKTQAFDMARSGDLLSVLEKIETALAPFHPKLRASGLPVFAAAGAASAQSEIGLFGTLSIVGVLSLLLLTFRALRPLLGVFLCLGAAVAAAFVVTHYVFGEVHLITLVFGVSLIGISVDYSFHYLCDMWSDPSWYPHAGLHAIGPGITLAMITSAIAFLTFLLSPFPGLQQMAVFSASGLLFAWVSVLGVLPWVGPQSANTPPLWGLSLTRKWLTKWPFIAKPGRWVILGVIAATIVGGITQLQLNDHISMLQNIPDDMLEDSQFVRSVAPGQRASQFYLIEAPGEQALLEREQSFVELLRASGIHATALSNFFPDQYQQRRDHDLLKEAFFNDSSTGPARMRLFFESIGAANIFAQAHEVFSEQASPLPLSKWIQAAPPHLRALYLGCDAEEICRSAIALGAVSNTEAYAELANGADGVRWVDQVASISALLGEYRIIASQLLLGVFAALTLTFSIAFGISHGLRIVAVPALAILVALGVFGMTAQPFSLFNLLGLMMVFGISIDYALFYALHGRSKPTTALAIFLSAATTLLAFGMLAFSSTTIVHTVGMTLAVGILTALVVAPIAASAASK